MGAFGAVALGLVVVAATALHGDCVAVPEIEHLELLLHARRVDTGGPE
jgi:hypothetical protein